MEASNTPLVLINAFEVSEGREDEFIRGWEATRDYLQAQPGYVDTALHQAVSPRTFQAAIQSSGFREVSEALVDFRPHPALYRIVRT